ncbi:AAA family ATPase [Priestia sp. FSL H7-0729]
MRFKIFIGPRIEFDRQVPVEDTITLTNLVRYFDAKDSSFANISENYTTLVIYSDEYSGVADFFIEGFLIYCLYYGDRVGYQEVLLHNPPAKVQQQIETSQGKIDKNIEIFKYPKLEIEHLRTIKGKFDDVIVGQTTVKSELLSALYSLTNQGIHKPTVVMLYGPTSVGKTETAKFVSNTVNGKDKLFRKQLSMYHNENFMNYIFGDKSSSFAKDLLDRETNIILLDEFDKAHPMFYSAFYQLFDEGVYTDKFYEVNLENTIIFCTSNYLNEREIKKKLGSPIFSRFDHFIKFNELSVEAKKEIINRVYIEELQKFNWIDQQIIEEKNIKIKLENHIKSLSNAREIRKVMIQMMAYPLIDQL